MQTMAYGNKRKISASAFYNLTKKFFLHDIEAYCHSSVLKLLLSVDPVFYSISSRILLYIYSTTTDFYQLDLTTQVCCKQLDDDVYYV